MQQHGGYISHKEVNLFPPTVDTNVLENILWRTVSLSKPRSTKCYWSKLQGYFNVKWLDNHYHYLSNCAVLQYLCFSVTLSLQWQKLADSPPRIRCSSCVTCRRSSGPTSSSSPISSAMQPGCSRLELLTSTHLSHSPTDDGTHSPYIKVRNNRVWKKKVSLCRGQNSLQN